MLFGVWADHQLKVTNHTQCFKELLPERFGCRTFVALGIRTQHLHDVAEPELVDVDDFLPDLGKGEVYLVPTIATATAVVRAMDGKNPELFNTALRAQNVRTHD